MFAERLWCSWKLLHLHQYRTNNWAVYCLLWRWNGNLLPPPSLPPPLLPSLSHSWETPAHFTKPSSSRSCHYMKGCEADKEKMLLFNSKVCRSFRPPGFRKGSRTEIASPLPTTHSSTRKSCPLVRDAPCSAGTPLSRHQFSCSDWRSSRDIKAPPPSPSVPIWLKPVVYLHSVKHAAH